MTPSLRDIDTRDDIPADLRGTAVGDLLEYHNLGRAPTPASTPSLLIGMCMDNRNQLRIPSNFAFILRSGGANLRSSEFKVSYAIAVGGVRAVAIIGHTNCGMVNLTARSAQFISGLEERAGWTRQQAEEHFRQNAPLFEIGNEIDFTLGEAKRLGHRYARVPVVPMIYKVEDHRLYLIEE